MKKNKMMRAASALMVATLLTTSVISGTFAKYTTNAVGGDVARVATWGFTQTTIELDDLFKSAYDSTTNPTVKNSTESNSDLIAPGTTGSDTFSFTYAGQENAPEVAYTFEVSTEGSYCAEDIKNNPNIKWELDNGEWGTWDQLITAIEALDGNKIANGSLPANYYAPGTLPDKFNKKNANEHTVKWKWEFETQGDTTDQDVKDTAMGNKYEAMDNNKVFLDLVNLVITITATQID